jgi:hypothetical protein
MKKASRQVRERDTMRAEYDFTNGVRGRYAPRFQEGVNVVVLDPDVAQAYGSSEAVNRALRAILEVAPTRARRRRTA